MTDRLSRGYSLILLGLGILALAGWIAMPDAPLDRNGKPLDSVFSNVYAAAR
jgi:alpha-1,2-mannosyltransferase